MRGDVFVGIDDYHSLWSSHNNNTKTYHLIVHSAVDSDPYTCLLMSTDGRVVNSVTQYVLVEELGR